MGGMTKDPGEQQPAERLLDLALYAPVGLALSVLEAVPELIRKGRARLGPQVGTARTIGQFAVRQGYRQFVGFATSQRGFPFRPAEPAKTYSEFAGELTQGHGNGAADGHTGPLLAAAELDERPGDPGADIGAASLAIPSYDSLSATQVVERLAGLSRDEVAAVAAYEAATRRRKTILARAEKLLR